MIDRGVVACSQAGEVLADKRWPLRRQPQHPTIRLEAQHGTPVFGQRQLDSRPGARRQLTDERYAVAPPFAHRRAGEGIRRRQALVGEHALGELDEAVVVLAGRGPEPQRTEQRTTVAAQHERERVERHGELERSTTQSQVRHSFTGHHTSPLDRCRWA